MTNKFVRILMAAMFIASIASFAQTGEAAAASTPDAPSASLPSAPGITTGTKVGAINIEQAIFATNEGQRDFQALSKKLQPKQAQLKTMSDELDSLKKQLNTQGDTMNEMARGDLVKEIEEKQKEFDRSRQDAQDDFQSQENDIAQKILQKMAPIIMKYATGHGFGLIMDTSNPWPQGPVLWSGQSLDITKPVVDAYNAESGVPAPTASTAPSRPATHPSGTAHRKDQ
jgi:Skp family chaperone for outer membrane proteins